MSHTFVGIDHVQVAAPVGCEEQARAFYGSLLGMEEIPKPEELRKRGGCWFQAGKQEIHIGVEDMFQPAKKAHPAFVVNDLTALMERLVKNGVKVKEDNAIEGRKRFFADDPWGNRLEFMEWDE
ncbi:VOC family protein [Brevibacillus dissolubilis]|uniref:VOC family protein n=1 Tax=Brevibacillus dissolubilis TaxID=1844116 RepID=UPI0011175A0D|nr:VOC family protein [Brevibacillus dissolubilis]